MIFLICFIQIVFSITFGQLLVNNSSPEYCLNFSRTIDNDKRIHDNSNNCMLNGELNYTIAGDSILIECMSCEILNPNVYITTNCSMTIDCSRLTFQDEVIFRSFLYNNKTIFSLSTFFKHVPKNHTHSIFEVKVEKNDSWIQFRDINRLTKINGPELSVFLIMYLPPPALLPSELTTWQYRFYPKNFVIFVICDRNKQIRSRYMLLPTSNNSLYRIIEIMESCLKNQSTTMVCI